MGTDEVVLDRRRGRGEVGGDGGEGVEGGGLGSRLGSLSQGYGD